MTLDFSSVNLSFSWTLSLRLEEILVPIQMAALTVQLYPQIVI